MLYLEIKGVEDLCPLVIKRSFSSYICVYALVELMTTVSCYGVIAAECRPVSSVKYTAFLQALSESCYRWIPDFFLAIVKKTSRHQVSRLGFSATYRYTTSCIRQLKEIIYTPQIWVWWCWILKSLAIHTFMDQFSADRLFLTYLIGLIAADFPTLLPEEHTTVFVHE